MDWKKNFPLLAGIGVPILMILFVAGAIYLPGLVIKPKYNFLYSGGDQFPYNAGYAVKDGKLTRSTVPLTPSPGQEGLGATLYVHDVKVNESREASFEEAQKLTLDPNAESPDGFRVVQGGSEGGFFPFFFFSDGDYGTVYLKGRNVSKKMDVKVRGDYYTFRFLGWIQ